MCQTENETANTALAELYAFINRELTAMTTNVVNNYAENMANREINPFLTFDDLSIMKYMALGRSVDAQLGHRIQRIIFYLARVRYGLLNVPNCVTIDIVNHEQKKIRCSLYSVAHNLPAQEQNANFDPYKQAVLIGGNKSDRDIKRQLKVKASTDAMKKLSYEFDGIPDDVLDYIRIKSGKRIPIDLLFFDCDETALNNANTFEIKMGGNLDTKNSESNAREVKDLLTLFSFLQNNFSYFATCYGVSSASITTDIQRIVGNNAILNNIAFWEKVIPSTEDTYTYNDFIDVFKRAFVSSGLEESLKNL